MTVFKRVTLALCALLFLAAGQTPVRAADTATPPAAAAAAAERPQGNQAIRQWYNDQVAVIPALNERWLSEGLSAEERARRAQEIRHAARLKARDFMADKREVADLQARDREKYGNPDGPTFEQLVQKTRDNGLTGDAVYQEIINSAGRTSRDYNDKFGVKPRAQSP